MAQLLICLERVSVREQNLTFFGHCCVKFRGDYCLWCGLSPARELSSPSACACVP